MKTYLVGGAVRDRLLGVPVGDRDHVVVGATPQQMLDAGFRPVGKDFPVFLHPDTREEYALARTERKTAPGDTGFAFHAEPGVTLEQDLARRDFTINAIAEGEDGALVDPHGGVRDLEARVLRHVSPAFAEDPVRILRGARFLARLAPLGFRVADETLALMRGMVAAGEADHLVAERVWQELQRALAQPMPSAALGLLRDCGALRVLLPEVDALFGVPQRPEYHPEVDSGLHTQMVCDMAARLAPGNARIGFAALTHDLGKALTPAHVLPKHLMHEHAGLEPLKAVCDRENIVLNQEVDPAHFDEGSARDDTLRAGEFSLHDVFLIHGSRANRSKRRRAGFVIRYMPATSLFDRGIQRAQSQAGVAFDLSRRPIWLVRGQDRAGNDLRTGHGEAYRLVPRASDEV